MPFSVAIIAQDEADRIGPCIQSVAFADEIVVVDSGSQDETRDIAKSMGCRVIEHPWMGYARQKQFAVDQCRHDWVLILDADERIPEETAGQIQQIMAAPDPNTAAYQLNRKNFFHGRWIRHCGWWPNPVVRLVNRTQGRFSDNLVHEQWIVHGHVEKLPWPIEHHSFRNYADLVEKMQAYSTLAAQQMAQHGTNAYWWEPMSHGLWMFIRTYVLELGLLEGFDGFMIALLNGMGSFMKYAKLRELRLF